MSLADEIDQARERAWAALDAVDNYFQDTLAVWGLIKELVESGQAFDELGRSVQARFTAGEIAEKSQQYLNEYVAEATFQQFLAIFENFFFDLFRLWLTAYPHSMGKRNIDFASVLSLPDKAAITDQIVSQELNQISYGRVADWFAALDDRVKLGCPTPDEVERIAEAKASRDLLVHNRGFVNATYLAKAGRLARYAEGERIEVIDPYHRDVWTLLRKVVGDMSAAAVAKAT